MVFQVLAGDVAPASFGARRSARSVVWIWNHHPHPSFISLSLPFSLPCPLSIPVFSSFFFLRVYRRMSANHMIELFG